MNIEKYHLESNKAHDYFEFTSIGAKGTIGKIIQFQATSSPGVFNLAFGDKNHDTGEMNDLSVSNNGDTQKVLRTVVEALYNFLDKHPEAIVYATGSTLARTRLYRTGITRFYHEVQNDFEIYGQIGTDLYFFEKGKEYAGFVIQRKLK